MKKYIFFRSLSKSAFVLSSVMGIWPFSKSVRPRIILRQHHTIKAAAPCAGSGRTAAVLCGNFVLWLWLRFLARVSSALPKFHGNTSNITAKLCLVSTQNLLANHSCSIMRYCLKDCGLARAVFFNQSVNLSLPDGQIDILENLIRTIALLNVVQWNHIHCSMLICLDYVIYYTPNTRLSPLITAQILLYIPVFSTFWSWSVESGLSCGQVNTNGLTKAYGEKYRSAAKKSVRVTGKFPVKLDLNNQIRCLLDRYRNISIKTEPGVQT